MAKAKTTVKAKSSKKTTAKKPEEPQKKPAANKDKLTGINEGLYYCSFCKKSPSADEDRLIAGPNKIFICGECVGVCVEIILQEFPKDWKAYFKKLVNEPKKNKKIPIIKEKF